MAGSTPYWDDTSDKYLNPQTQERTLGGHGFKVTAKKAGRYRSASTAKAKADARVSSGQAVVRHLAP